MNQNTNRAARGTGGVAGFAGASPHSEGFGGFAMGTIKRTLFTALAAIVLVAGIPIRAEGTPMNVGASPQVTAEIAAIYQASADSINKDLANAITALKATPNGERNAGAEFRAARAKELLDNVRDASRAATGRSVRVFTKAAESSYKAGASLAEMQAKELGLGNAGAGAAASLSGINRESVDAIARDSVARLSARTGQHAENAVSLFRSLSTSMAAGDAEAAKSGKTFSISEPKVNRIIADGLISGDPRRAMGAMRELIGNGAGFDAKVIEDYRKVGSQIITVGGWSGTLRTYAEMVVRTRTAEAQREGQIERQMSLGIDLAQVVGSSSNNFCTRFVGLVVVVRGSARDGYPALADLPGGGPPFHPNCTKNLAAYVEDLVSEGRATKAAEAAVDYREAVAKGTLTAPLSDRHREQGSGRRSSAKPADDSDLVSVGRIKV